MGSSPMSGSALTVWSLFGILSLSLSLSPFLSGPPVYTISLSLFLSLFCLLLLHVHSLSLSLSQK